MPSPRTTLAFLAAVAASALPAGAAAAVPAVTAFPVVGNVRFVSDFGAPRWQGSHEGNDIMAPRHAPAVAFERGTVDIHFRSHSSTCMLYLHGASGMTYVYIHLNNDLTMRNDNTGGCREGVAYAPGLRDGQRVYRGQYIAKVGDSGDADGIAPHLHFEIRTAAGRAINPYEHLRRARRMLFPGPAATSVPMALKMRATVRWTEGAELSVRTRLVKTSTKFLYALTRNLTMAVPADVVVERWTRSGRVPARLSSAVPGERITVWTKPFLRTWGRQIGARGQIAVARVLLGA